MIQKFKAPVMPGINEYTAANRKSKYAANEMKTRWQGIIGMMLRKYKIQKVESGSVIIRYYFFEKDRRRDKDNVSGFAHKVIQDALVLHKIIPNDGWEQIVDYRDYFDVDPKDPRIVVELEEVEK